MSEKITVPVAFAFFVREDTTLRVFEQIRKARPERLYLIADGYRPEKSGEKERVAALRKKIESMIDWTDKVDFDYADQNMGCARRLASGWRNVLDKYGKAMLIEDDCVPNQSFFHFQQHLLNEYEHDDRVVSVSGTYFLGRRNRTGREYGFTHFPQIWGWGAWARSLDGFDLDLNQWSSDFLYEIEKSKEIPSFVLPAWIKMLNDMKANPNFTWDIQFWLNCLRLRQLTIFPYHNLVSNIGYTQDATHTTCWWFSDRKTFEHDWQWVDTGCPIDLHYEQWLQDNFYWGRMTFYGFYHSALLWMLLRYRRIKKFVFGKD